MTITSIAPTSVDCNNSQMALIIQLVLWTALAQVSTGPVGASAVEICPPVDEAAKDPELFLFRARLQRAVARRDVGALLRVTSPDVRISFGPADGFDAFRRRLLSPGDEIWAELATALALGGSFETPTSFVAPYTFGCTREFERLIVVGADVNVRSGRSVRSSVISLVSFGVLKGQVGTSESAWAEVELPDGRKGYVAAEFVRGSMDYRAYLEKRGGAWRLSAFIAGD